MEKNKCMCPFCEHEETKRKALEALIQKAVASTITDYVPLLVPDPCMELKHRTLQEINEKLHEDFRVVGITKNRWTSTGPSFQNIPKNEPSYSTAQFLEDQFKEKDAKAQESVDYSHIEKHVQDEMGERLDELKKQTSKPPYGKNFCRVFELPDSYPEGFCFGGGKPVLMLMVDWFNPWPDNPELKTWEDVVKLLRPFLQKKTYVKPGKRYILITDFGASLVFTKED